jgi:serine/threonine-protein kinase
MAMSQPPPKDKSATPAPRAGTSATEGNRHADLPTMITADVADQPNGLAGQVFGDFELTEELGRGGMGVVYKATQRSLGRPVAIKLLLREFASNPTMLTRFLAEARAAASLAHPNVISIYQISECSAGPYFVMELIDGPSLESMIERRPPIPWVVAVMTTVAEAVQHAHERGIIHRDLKPANILLHQKKRPVVTDFGIAKLLGPGAANLTRPGTLIGSPMYMPPEQAGDDLGKVGPPSDVYSLGAITYALLTGRAPFDEGAAMKTILRVISADPPPPVRSLRPEVPAALERIVMRCLQKRPDARYGSAQALAKDLERLRAALRKAPASSGTLPAAAPVLLLVGAGDKKARLSNASTTVGRALDCDLVVKSLAVSKHHCRIRLTPKGATVEDLGSANGTFVNGRQLDSGEVVELADGDKLDLAGHEFTVRWAATSSR